jgi:hypothetical protein
MEVAMRDARKSRTEAVSNNTAKPAPAADGALDEAALAQATGGAQEDYLPAVQNTVMGDGSVKPGVITNSPLIRSVRPGN